MLYKSYLREKTFKKKTSGAYNSPGISDRPITRESTIKAVYPHALIYIYIYKYKYLLFILYAYYTQYIKHYHQTRMMPNFNFGARSRHPLNPNTDTTSDNYMS